MKQTLKVLVVLTLFFVSFSNELYAQDDQTTITVNLRKGKGNAGDKPEIPVKGGTKTPLRWLLCWINPTIGVQIENCDEEINSYEIWDASSVACSFATTTEYDFVDTLFTLSGDYQIRFVTDDFVYEGYISIP